MGNRHRYMYYATGLPGWMRFGYSPGWLGVSPTGMGPAASYLMTGQWPTPQMAAAWQGRQFPMALEVPQWANIQWEQGTYLREQWVIRWTRTRNSNS